jgi:uncharacterized protein (TIGR03083 family)
VATVDASTAYPALRDRICALVLGADADVPVPACPGWTVRNVLSHVVGVTTDVLAGRIEGVATDPWTAAQVDARRDAGITALVDEWRANAEAFDALIPAMGAVSGQLVFDTWTHEQDLRGALGVPGHRDAPELQLAVDFLCLWWKPRLRVEAGTLAFPEPESAPDATVRTSAFEFVRAVSGRRSAEQVAAYEWEPEPRPELLRFDFFGFRPDPLVE